MILPMARVMILGPRRDLHEALGWLQAQGVLHLRPLPGELAGARVKRIPLEEAQAATERRLEEAARGLQDLLLLLPRPEREGGAAALPDVAAAEFPARLEELASQARAGVRRLLALGEERELLARYERLVTALAPLRPRLPGIEQAETLGVLVRRDRPEVLPLLEAEVSRVTRGAYGMLWREVDAEQLAVLLTVPREIAPGLSQRLFERGISEIKLPEGYAGRSLIDTLSLLLARSRRLPAEMREVESELATLSRWWYGPVRRALRTAEDRLARARAVARCGQTEHAFVIAGWIPAARSGRLGTALEEAFGGRLAVLETPIREEDYAQVPVVLSNPGFLRPFELLLSLLPLPRYGSIDPTPFLAAFFPLFFGVMLGDVGFGGLTLVLASVARARGWGGETGQKVSLIALACSASAIVFGVLFGEFFGELGGALGLRPLLLDRREAPLRFLALALALGAVHIVLGIALALWGLLRQGRRRQALARSSTLGMIVAAVVGVVARLGYLPAAAGTGALLAGGAFLLIAVVLEGVLAPLAIVIALGNILSYARLMALGIASVMLADVAHRMAEVFAPPVLGVTAAVLLHGVNFAMGLFGPAIQALRLHYVEFFDKFYEAGGKPFEPFHLTA